MITDYTKQMELIKPWEHKRRINVLGCGAAGSWVVFFLLKMGFENIHVYDFDTIEEHNIPNQMFKESQIGCTKLDSIVNIYNDFFNEENKRLTIHNTKITEDNAHVLKDIVLCCVDSMMARKFIYENCYKYGQAELFIELRLSIWGAYVYTLYKNGKDWTKKYEDTLYADEETEVSACGVSQTALPAAVNAASIMIMKMIVWLRGENPQHRLEYSIPDVYAITNE